MKCINDNRISPSKTNESRPTPNKPAIRKLHRLLRKGSSELSTESAVSCTSRMESSSSESSSSEQGMEDGKNVMLPFQSRLTQVAERRRWEIHDSVIDVIGQTPILPLQARTIETAMKYDLPPNVRVYVKCENMNPGGSLKDRLALGIIEWAEQCGKLQPGQTVIEASSGNTGIGLAMICASKGYPFVCVMSESFSVERRQLMRFLGARVILTPAANKATGMLIKAQELAQRHGFFYAKQFETEANAWIHEQTTGKEILDAFAVANQKLDHFFMSYGTGGTVLGVGRALRQGMPDCQIHLCEPANAPMMKSGIPTQYPTSGPSTSFATAHPVWNPHVFQGWATDFIPKLAHTSRMEGIYDTIEHVKGADAIRVAKALAQSEGIFVGISGGGILAATLAFAQTCPPGTTLLAMLTDTGERYLSTALFDDIPIDMTAEEAALAASTPGRAPPPPPPLSGLLPPDTDELFDL